MNKTITGKQVGNFLLNNAVIIMMLIAAVVVSILRPNFISEYNAKNLISNTAARFIVALGVSGCLITKARTFPPAVWWAWRPACPPPSSSGRIIPARSIPKWANCLSWVCSWGSC